MENASKALIIAGAILISILIIGLGVYIFGKAKGTVGKIDLTGQEATAQNQQFDEYFGNNVSAQEVKTLLSSIRSNNITGAKNKSTQTIAVVYGAAAPTTSVSTISSQIESGKTYTVEAYNDSAMTTDDTSTFTAGTGAGTSAAYYSNGYLRIIKITVN